MKNWTIGTAGHIDHGKTAMVRALTGINTDRLPEEALRGITIELGFAHHDLPSGIRCGIVDVPGHERFVKTMVAGVGGIDAVLLVIAADEGIMPQTKEHLDICTLLGIKWGIVVLTKCDLVEQNWLELVEDDLQEYLKDSFLAKAKRIHFSVFEDQGKAELIAALDGMAQEATERNWKTPMRLPVDRVFSIKGFGTVVTGTLQGGRIALGEEVEILPTKVRTKVRGLQVHGMDVTEVFAGSRVAMNLGKTEREVLSRGMVLTSPDILKPTSRLDAKVEVLTNVHQPLKNRAKLQFHCGTTHTLSEIRLLGQRQILPGASGYAQIFLDTPITTLPGDRFILRGFTILDNYGTTIGGGKVLDPLPVRHRLSDKQALDSLVIHDRGDLPSRIEILVASRGYAGSSKKELRTRLNNSDNEIDRALDTLMSQNLLIRFDKEFGRFLAQQTYDTLVKSALQIITDYHSQNPLSPGIDKEELKSKLPATINAKVFTTLMTRLSKANSIAIDHDIVHLAGFKAQTEGKTKNLEEQLRNVYLATGLTPPGLKELVEKYNHRSTEITKVLSYLADTRFLIHIKKDLYFHSEAIKSLERRLVEFLNKQDAITTSEFKEMTKVSRKYLIPLAEYFDAKQITIRVGEKRLLRKK